MNDAYRILNEACRINCGEQVVELRILRKGVPYLTVGVLMEVTPQRVRVAYSSKGGVVVDEQWFEVTEVHSARLVASEDIRQIG